ncbi:hypothetical protein FACS189485_16310 [Spirochaetia bacterium]|nr:hypothetical protein FACS189485_16310 [Spirochaetia bacterium]
MSVNLGHIRNRVLRDNPEVKSVGIIKNWTGEDDKYIALDIIFNDDRRLFLTLVNYAHRFNRSPCWLTRIGDISFNVYSRYIADDGAYFGENTSLINAVSIDLIANEIGIKLSNTMIL